MVTRWTWSAVRDRSESAGRRDAGRVHLKAARNALATSPVSPEAHIRLRDDRSCKDWRILLSH